MKDTRYLPERLFPPYSYLPGKFVHPESPGGYRSNFPLGIHFSQDEFLYALDLLNHGYYWESHVYFEAFWNHQKRQGISARFYQVMILVCAAEIKLASGGERTGHSFLDKIESKLKLLLKEQEQLPLDLNLTDLIEQVRLRKSGKMARVRLYIRA